MEKNEKVDCDSEKCCGGYCGAGYHGSRRFWFFRLLIVVIGLLVAFALGTAFGKAHEGWEGGRFGMMDGRGGPGTKMMRGARGGEEQFAGSAVSGVITKVEGSKITIADNGGKSQVVATSANTIIVSAGVEVGASSLSAGQFIRATGTRGTDSQFVARMISVSGQ